MNRVSSYVYAFDYGNFVKVGVTKDHKLRQAAIKTVIGMLPLRKFRVECLDAYEVETEIKNKLQNKRADVEHYKTECFSLGFDFVVREIKEAAARNNEYNRRKYTSLGFYPLRIDKDLAKKIVSLQDQGVGISDLIDRNIKKSLLAFFDNLEQSK